MLLHAVQTDVLISTVVSLVLQDAMSAVVQRRLERKLTLLHPSHRANFAIKMAGALQPKTPRH